MPWERRGKCVYRSDTGEKEGCSDTEEKAKKYLKALYANEPKQEHKMTITNQRIKEIIMEEAGEYLAKLLIEADAGAYHDPQERLGLTVGPPAITKLGPIGMNRNELANAIAVTMRLAAMAQKQPVTEASIRDYMKGWKRKAGIAGMGAAALGAVAGGMMPQGTEFVQQQDKIEQTAEVGDNEKAVNAAWAQFNDKDFQRAPVVSLGHNFFFLPADKVPDDATLPGRTDKTAGQYRADLEAMLEGAKVEGQGTLDMEQLHDLVYGTSGAWSSGTGQSQFRYIDGQYPVLGIKWSIAFDVYRTHLLEGISKVEQLVAENPEMADQIAEAYKLDDAAALEKKLNDMRSSVYYEGAPMQIVR